MNKKKRIFIITGIVIAVIIAVLAVLLIINKKNETPTNTTNVDGVVLKENVIVITDETDEELQPYKIDENNLYFKKKPKYQETEIIVSGITKTAPNGYIRKIVKIEETNGEYVLKTEPATFLDVFEVLHLTATIELTEDESGNFSVDETTKNALSILPKLSLSATNKSTTKSSISKDKDSDNSNDDNGKRKNLFEIEFDEEIDGIVHLQGNASAKVWLEIKIDIEAGEITWSLTANDEIQSHILIGCGASYDKEFEKELFSKQLPNIQIMAGPIPIVITNEVGANLAFEAGIAGEIGTSVDILQTSKNGFVYTSKDCSVKEINDGELNSGGVECTTGAKATGTAKAGVVLSLTSLFYDCSGAELGLGVEASAEGEIALNDKTLGTDEKYYGKLALAISPCISGNIIVQIPVIDDDLYEMEIFKVELKPFWEKVWENKDTNEIVDVLSKDYSNELWWISYKDIIKTIKNSKEYVTFGEIVPFPGDVWKDVSEGGPGRGGLATSCDIQNGDEMLYCLKSTENTVPLLVVARKRKDDIKIVVVYQFKIREDGIRLSRAITYDQTLKDNKDIVLLCTDSSLYHAPDYDWQTETIISFASNGETNERDYNESTDKSKLIKSEDMTWTSIKKWNEKDLVVETTENKTVLNSTDYNKIYKKIITTTQDQNKNSTKIYFPTSVSKKWKAPENWVNSGTYTTGYPSQTGDLVYALKDVTYDKEKIPELFIGVKQNDTIKVLAVYSIDSSTGANLMIVKKIEDNGDINYVSWSLPTLYSESYFATHFPSWSYGGGSCCNKYVFAKTIEELNLVWIPAEEFN